MPIDPVTGTLIGYGVSAGISGGNMIAQGRMNKKNREWAEGQNKLRLQWDRENWEMQNAYNHPQAIMQRYKSAGLNPNLIYDKGGASNVAGQISSGQMQNYEGRAPQMDDPRVGQGIADALRVKVAQDQSKASIDLLQNQIEKVQQEINESKMRIAGMGTRQAKDKFDLDLAKDLRASTLQQAINTTNIQGQSIQEMMQRIEFNNKMNPQLLKEKTGQIAMLEQNRLESIARQGLIGDQRYLIDAQINNYKALTSLTEQETEWKKWKNVLQSLGIDETSPLWVKLGGALAIGVLKGENHSTLVREGFRMKNGSASKYDSENWQKNPETGKWEFKKPTPKNYLIEQNR
jgi:hypothetical protein